MKRVLLLASLVVALVATLGSLTAWAQTPQEGQTTPQTTPPPPPVSRTGKIEFTGVVQAMGTSGWTISGLSVKVTDRTEVKRLTTVGSVVKVEGTLAEDGTVTAKEIGLKGNGRGESQSHAKQGRGLGRGNSHDEQDDD